MKPLKMSSVDKEAVRAAMLKQVEESLKTLSPLDTTFTLKVTMASLINAQLPSYGYPIVLFSAVAWLKMNQLVRVCKKEVGMQGTVERTQDADGDIYYIKDIFVYPQTVTGMTCNSDDTLYPEWTMQLSL